MTEIINVPNCKCNDVIFILKLKEIDLDNGNRNYYTNIFSCFISEIADNIEMGFTLWNGDNTIEHYGCDYMPLNDMANSYIYFEQNFSEIEAICELLKDLLEHGLTEKERNEDLEQLIDSFQESIQDIQEGKTVDIETAFNELENDLLQSATEEEKIRIFKNREKRNKYPNERRLCYDLINRVNHKLCINAIEEFYTLYLVEKMKEGE